MHLWQFHFEEIHGNAVLVRWCLRVTVNWVILSFDGGLLLIHHQAPQIYNSIETHETNNAKSRNVSSPMLCPSTLERKCCRHRLHRKVQNGHLQPVRKKNVCRPRETINSSELIAVWMKVPLHFVRWMEDGIRQAPCGTLKRKCRHFDEILITGCTGSCHFDNFQCSQWWKFHQNEDISVSVN